MLGFGDIRLRYLDRPQLPFQILQPVLRLRQCHGLGFGKGWFEQALPVQRCLLACLDDLHTQWGSSRRMVGGASVDAVGGGGAAKLNRQLGQQFTRHALVARFFALMQCGQRVAQQTGGLPVVAQLTATPRHADGHTQTQ